MLTTLVARQDSLGDVLLAGPAIRAVAASSRVVLLCSPAGAAAARLLPGVDEVIVEECPWITADPDALDPETVATMVRRVRAVGADAAVVLTSPRQSALPTALVLRLAGVPNVAAYSRDYPGSLLDLRLRVDPPVHEVERNLQLVEAAGFPTPDDVRLAVQHADLPTDVLADLPAHFVAVHPGSTAISRTMSPGRWSAVCSELLDRGVEVVVTGLADEPTNAVADAVRGLRSLSGRTSFAELAAVLRRADAVCVGNTGAMHLAAAVGTPVVACFPPTVPTEQWRPWKVEQFVLDGGRPSCSPCYRRDCDRPGHPCAEVPPAEVADAAMALIGIGVA